MAISDIDLATLIRNEKIKIINSNFVLSEMFKKMTTKEKEDYINFMKELGFNEKQVKKLEFDGRQIESGSIDLRLGHSFVKPKRKSYPIKLGEKIEYEEINENEPVIYPGEYMLGTTQETVKLSPMIAACVDGRSSIGRCGLHVENAGWVDPGFKGEITLELFNCGNRPIKLIPGYRVCQLVFESMTNKPKFPYNGKYQGQIGATGSMSYKDYDINELNDD